MSTLPEVPALERMLVDWERHKGDKRPKILPPPGEVWRNPTTNRKIGHRYYTRVTTYADAITEGYNLTAWKLRRAVFGASQRRDYLTRIASLTLDDRDRDDLDEIVARCLEAAGPNAADLGTALHALTERLDRGEDLGTPPEEVLPDLAAYTALTSGLIRYAHREARVVCDQLECAGTPDGHAYIAEPCPAGCGPEVLHIIDTKTGSIRYPGKMATQLAIYSRSDLYDPATGERTPVEVCQQWGAIIHLPVETGECAPYWLDLEHGWRGAELCGPVREWHRAKADDVLRPFVTVQPVRVVDGEATRFEPRLASTNTKAAPAPDPADITEQLAESQRVPVEVGLGPAFPVALDAEVAPESEDAADVDGTDEPETVERCSSWSSESDPAAVQCEHPAGHAGAHEFDVPVVPVERCPRTDLRLGECACIDCRPDLAAVADDGAVPDPVLEPVEWPGVDDLEVEARTLRDPATGETGTLIGPADKLAEIVRPEAEVDPLLDEIRRCYTVRDVELLSSQRWRQWGPEHRALAVEVHDRLAAAEAAERPRAAFVAAVQAATTVADVEAVVHAAEGAAWLDDYSLEVAGQRWRELRSVPA